MSRFCKTERRDQAAHPPVAFCQAKAAAGSLGPGKPVHFWQGGRGGAQPVVDRFTGADTIATIPYWCQLESVGLVVSRTRSGVGAREGGPRAGQPAASPAMD